MSDEQWMQKAIVLAWEAQAQGEVPVGAVIVRDGDLVGAVLDDTLNAGRDHG